MKGLKKAIVFVLAFLILEICPFNTAAEAGSGGEDRRIIVAMGDSFSSGEGIEEFFYQNYPVEVKVTQEDWLAHRSQNSWSGMLKLRTLGGKLITMSDYHWNGKNGDTACWYFTAASGATTKDFRGRQGDKAYKKEYEYYPGGEVKTYLEGDPTLPPQMEIFNSLKGQRIDYVTLTLGGNDVGFADIMMLAASGIDFLDGKLSNKLNQEITKLDAPTGVLHNLENVYKDIFNETDKKAKIIVAGYPRLVPQALKKYEILSNPIEGAILYAGLFTPEERDEIINAVDLFNSKIEDLVVQCNRNGMSIYFVPVDEEFNGHEPGTYVPYLNGVVMPSQSEDLKDGQIFSSYSFHPNINGARTYAKCVQAKIDELEGVIGSGYCGGEDNGTNCTWFLSKDGILTIRGTGRMADWSFTGENIAPWFPWVSDIKSIIVEDGVTCIGESAFAACSPSSVKLADSVLEIGDNAFNACFGFEELVLPSALTSIGESAFSNSGIKRITIPNRVTDIGNSAFTGCFSLEKADILGAVTELNKSFFACSGLKELSLPKSLLTIGELTLSGCDSLTDIYYAGSEEQWNRIAIHADNEETLQHVTVHYAKVEPASTPTPEPVTSSESVPQSSSDLKWDKHEYMFFSNVAATWEDAERYCESIGGHLATITSPEENAYVYKLAKEYGSDAYIGLTNRGGNGEWQWITGETTSYLNWAYGSPTSNSRDCYAMFFSTNDVEDSGRWRNSSFDDEFGPNKKLFICEWDTAEAYTRHFHTVFGGSEFEPALDETITTSNAAHNNVVNNSLITSAGNKLYFFHDMLWTGNSDLSEAEEIGITNGSTISTDGNHLYFISGGINKYDTTRTGQYGNYEKIPFDNPYCDNLMLEKDWLYYIGIDIDSLSFSGPIWRIKTDNSVKECIYEGRSYCFNIYKGKVYFSNSEDDYCIYRMDLDGSNIEKLSTQGGVSIVIEDDWIYYLTDTTHQVLDSHFKNEIPVGKIYKMRLDGSENIKIRDGQAGNLNVWKGYLYYTCYEDGQTIHRISVNGTDDRILTNKRECSDICICNDMIFFKSKVRNLHGAYETHVMHMYLDGSDFDIPLHKERPVVEAVEKAADVIQAHLTAQFTGSIQPSFVQHTNSDDKLYIPVIERIMALSAKNSCWGMLYDVDGDSINELLVLYREKGGVSPSQVYAEVFSIRNGEAVSIMETAKINHDLGGEHGAFGVVEYGGEKYLCSYYNSGYSGPDAWDVARTRLFDPRTGNPAAEFESKAFNEYDSGAVNVTKVTCALNGKEVSKEDYDMWISQIRIVQLIDRKDNRYSLTSLLDAIS